MKRKLLKATFFALILMAGQAYSQTRASATWVVTSEPTPSTLPIVTPTVQGDIQASAQSGMDAFQYSTSFTAISDATGFQRTRSTSTAPQLPYGNTYDQSAYMQYQVQTATGKYLRIDTVKVTILGGGTGNGRLLVKYSTDGINFLDMPVSGSYFLADGTAKSYAATSTEPIVLINTGATVNTEAKRTLSFTGINKILAPGESYYIRLFPYLTDVNAPSSRYIASRQMTISGLAAPTLALPLNFLSFSAKSEGLANQVKLAWATANEVNTQNFVIEKKSGNDFVSIGTVNAKNTAGEHSYSFVDNSVSGGTNYYRLKQVDKDGNFQYSEVVVAESKVNVALSVYPNPANGSAITVSHPAASNAVLKVFNLGGVQVASATVSNGTSSTGVDISGLATGYYVVKFTANGEESSAKFVKQ